MKIEKFLKQAISVSAHQSSLAGVSQYGEVLLLKTVSYVVGRGLGAISVSLVMLMTADVTVES